MLSKVLELVRDVPTERLVEVLGEIHRKKRPGPFSVVDEPSPEHVDEHPENATPADAGLGVIIPVTPVSPTTQAREDLVEHEELLSGYAQRVQRFLDQLGPTDAAPLPKRPIQQLVPLRQSNEGAAGVFVIHNPGDRAAEVRVSLRGHRTGGGLRFEPARFTLEPGEARHVTASRTAVGLDVGFARELDVHLNDELALVVRVEMLVDGVPEQLADRDSNPPPDVVHVSLSPPDDELGRILREAQLLLVRHPLAAQALFRSFVAEGRRFAQTEEGRRLHDEIADSELIRRGRVLWEVGTLKLLEEQAPTVLPGKLLDAFVELTAAGDLEGSMTQLFGYGASDGHPADPTTD